MKYYHAVEPLFSRSKVYAVPETVYVPVPPSAAADVSACTSASAVSRATAARLAGCIRSSGSHMVARACSHVSR